MASGLLVFGSRRNSGYICVFLLSRRLLRFVFCLFFIALSFSRGFVFFVGGGSINEIKV